MNISGRLKITEKDGGKITQKGRIKCSDAKDIQTLEAEGDIAFKSISGVNAKLRGKIKGDSIDIQNLEVDGTIRIGNVISNICVMKLSQHNSIDKIVSKKIDIHIAEDRTSRIFTSLVNNWDLGKANNNKVDIREIIADTVSLEQCSCEKIVCDSLILHGRCKIKELIYKEKLEFDEMSKIEKIVHENGGI